MVMRTLNLAAPLPWRRGARASRWVDVGRYKENPDFGIGRVTKHTEIRWQL